MTDREFFDIMRQRAKKLAESSVRALDASETTDGAMFPDVARERVMKLRRLARQINALCDWLDALP